MSFKVIEVLVPVPVNKTFFYKLPKKSLDIPKPGTRVLVNFKNRSLVGIVWGGRLLEEKASNYKRIEEILDNKPLISKDLQELADWASRYYHYPLGEVISYFLSPSLRKGNRPTFFETNFWTLSNKGEFIDIQSLNRAPRQQAALLIFRDSGKELSSRSALAHGISAQILNSLITKGLLIRTTKEQIPITNKKTPEIQSDNVLTKEQQKALQDINARKNKVFLLNGITGSGKTEVYLQAIKKITSSGKQALVLIPEIGLAPQAEARFKKYFGDKVISFHSAKNERERLDAWLSAKKGMVDVVIGTRSSIFLPMKNLGMIVVDEEHDQSFKQFDRFRYSARDLALYRAKVSNIPLILASATPSLESLNNAITGKYFHLKITKRPAGAKIPKFIPVDLRGKVLNEGFSDNLLASIREELDKKNQVLIFLNRRGYASSLICKFCGWVSNCERCDAHLTVHNKPPKLLCHHCGAFKIIPDKCPSCSGAKFESHGLGTERLESFLTKQFSPFTIIRIDSDSTKKKDSISGYLEIIKKGKPVILLGTQMLAKGHHFPCVTLVGIVNADFGLFSADSRGSEKMAQIITQVAGRAGRGKKPGKVIIQTYCPDHPHIERLTNGSYEDFALELLKERKLIQSPPFSYQARIQSESVKSVFSRDFLIDIWKKTEERNLLFPNIKKIGPLPSLMEKKSGLFRWEINLYSQRRKSLHQALDILQFFLNRNSSKRRVRWSIDVDPHSTI